VSPTGAPASSRAGRRPLADAGPGERVRLVGIDGGRALRARLAAMGLVPGVQIDVLRSTGRGPLVVAILGSRVILGRGMARRMMVR